jgi:hypothetical protein
LELILVARRINKLGKLIYKMISSIKIIPESWLIHN